MENSLNRLTRAALAAASVVLLSAGPSLAQSDAVPCSAFVRTSYGGWKVLDPVVFDVDGRLFAPTVGTVFAGGSPQNDTGMKHILDQHCPAAGYAMRR